MEPKRKNSYKKHLNRLSSENRRLFCN